MLYWVLLEVIHDNVRLCVQYAGQGTLTKYTNFGDPLKLNRKNIEFVATSKFTYLKNLYVYSNL